MSRLHLIIAGIFGFLAVALGAFGAHSLKSILSESQLNTFNTGVLYHLVHSAVLTALAVSDKEVFNRAFIFIAGGIFLFSFSLYLLAVTEVKFFAYVTPFGGVSFLIGWMMLIDAGIKLKK